MEQRTGVQNNNYICNKDNSLITHKYSIVHHIKMFKFKFIFIFRLKKSEHEN